MELNAFKIVTLLRVSPVIPFNIFNYFVGTTSVSIPINILSFVGLLPDVVLYTWIGTGLKDI